MKAINGTKAATEILKLVFNPRILEQRIKHKSKKPK